jgi:hypothetical protein
LRVLVTLALAIALFWVAASFFMLRNAENHADPNLPCSSATALLGLWRSQRVIERIGNDGRDVRVLIDRSTWAGRLTKKNRIDIGMAAWCHVQAMGNGGKVIIHDTYGGELGQVAEGKWSSKLFGE